MQIVPYKSCGNMVFAMSTQDDCLTAYGQPCKIQVNRDGEVEFHYFGFIMRFSSSDCLFRECTLLPRFAAVVAIPGAVIPVTWDDTFLVNICKADVNPVEAYGFLILNSLGIAITGLQDRDESQVAITAFSKGDFDEFLENSIPYDCGNGEGVRNL